LLTRWRSWRCCNTLLPNLALRSRKLARIKK
ncbi:Ribonucleoside-diphosphate reductase 1 subunit alpha, partial [Haemophilus influenzae]